MFCPICKDEVWVLNPCTSKNGSYYGEACYKCWKNKGLKLMTDKKKLDEFYKKLDLRKSKNKSDKSRQTKLI
ncbi:MAG TPA: hypothetical protein QGG70_03405 [Candidatus Pacearchaeota archaeon]|jgi:hypothetical protein|nr:hypothetical protein [Candidatus Pacearchaeota archaeon]